MTDTPLYEFDPREPSPNGRRYDADTWDRIRKDYVSGLSAAEVSKRHGVGISTLRNRAAVEGWRRRDDPFIPLDAHAARLHDEYDGIVANLEFIDLAELADTRMRHAMLEARPTEVLRWHRIHALMCQEARDYAQMVREEDALADPDFDIEAAMRRDDDPPRESD